MSSPSDLKAFFETELETIGSKLGDIFSDNDKQLFNSLKIQFADALGDYAVDPDPAGDPARRLGILRSVLDDFTVTAGSRIKSAISGMLSQIALALMGAASSFLGMPAIPSYLNKPTPKPF